MHEELLASELRKATVQGPTEEVTVANSSSFEIIDLFINICLTLLGFIPGHIHAFYLEYVYFDRREQARHGRYATGPAPAVYSDNVQTGGYGYGTMNQGN
jgi:hypothetical protein